MQTITYKALLTDHTFHCLPVILKFIQIQLPTTSTISAYLNAPYFFIEKPHLLPSIHLFNIKKMNILYIIIG